MSKLIVDLEKVAHTINLLIPAVTVLFALLGYTVSFYFHFLTVVGLFLTAVNVSYIYGQKRHALLANFGLLAQGRYILESIGPELRQYLFATDTEERPFNRIERAEVYRKAQDVDSSSSFGTQLSYDQLKLAHSMFPVNKEELEPFALTFGEERGLENSYTITKPVIISGMSFGALGENAVRALSRGARFAGIPMNTGEGGHPKYHLIEGSDLIFQIGTAKFGVRHPDGRLDEDKLRALAAQPHIKMIELKLSQGAKPGKGGLLPREKITPEIAQLRGVPMGTDVVSPPYHSECHDVESTVRFIAHLQEVSQIPVGIKLCLGRLDQFRALAREMKRSGHSPDFITIDGAEGGTGAAPKSFMDEVGMSLMRALPIAHKILIEEGVRDRLKILASGKLVNAGRQLQAISLGADAVCSARGFMLAIGCIQALQCNKNSCPVGITTHNFKLQRGLDVELKAERVHNYVKNLLKEQKELLAAVGLRDWHALSSQNLVYPPTQVQEMESSS
jgi:glutamate synthase domain-containing protein 2